MSLAMRAGPMAAMPTVETEPAAGAFPDSLPRYRLVSGHANRRPAMLQMPTAPAAARSEYPIAAQSASAEPDAGGRQWHDAAAAGLEQTRAKLTLSCSGKPAAATAHAICRTGACPAARTTAPAT